MSEWFVGVFDPPLGSPNSEGKDSCDMTLLTRLVLLEKDRSECNEMDPLEFLRE